MPKNKPKKSLGQNFLKCRWAVSALINSAEVGPRDAILEIGPGAGVLTLALARRAKKVLAVEKDESLAEELRAKLVQSGTNNVRILKGDILKKYPVIAKKLKKFKIVANIPYYLTSRLFRTILETEPRPELVVLTVQKEVARRITARPPRLNLLALSVQAFGKPRVVKNVPSSCFWPKPEVDSAIIKITEISGGFFTKNRISSAKFFELARVAFSQKRKKLINNLAKIRPRDELQNIWESLGLSQNIRAEALSLENWLKIIKKL